MYPATVEIGVFVGCVVTVHTGFVISLHVPVNVVFAVNVTFALGSYVPLNFGVLYHALVLHVSVGNIILQFVAVFQIVHHVLVAHILETHTHVLNVAVTALYVTA